MFFANLTPEKVQALNHLYDSSPGKEKRWDEMTPEERRAAEALGYKKNTWDNVGDEDDTVYDTPWVFLNDDERQAATILGMEVDDFDGLDGKDVAVYDEDDNSIEQITVRELKEKWKGREVNSENFIWMKEFRDNKWHQLSNCSEKLGLKPPPPQQAVTPITSLRSSRSQSRSIPR